MNHTRNVENLNERELRPEEDLAKVTEARRLAGTMRQWRECRYGAWQKQESAEAVAE